jgi:hypothetical protein
MPRASSHLSSCITRGAHKPPLKQYFLHDHVWQVRTARMVSRPRMIFEGRIAPVPGTNMPKRQGPSVVRPM